MTEGTRTPEPPEPARADSSTTAGPPSWLKGLTLWVGVIVGVALLAVLGVALLPGWWAGLIGGQVWGVPSRGVSLGVAIGAAFTLLPLIVALVTIRVARHARPRTVLVVLALLLLLPNVLTFAVSLGSGDPRSVLAIQAPGFVGGTAAGVGLVVALVLLTLGLRWWLRRRRAAGETTAGTGSTAATPERKERSATTSRGTRRRLSLGRRGADKGSDESSAPDPAAPPTSGDSSAPGDGAGVADTPGPPQPESSPPPAQPPPAPPTTAAERPMTGVRGPRSQGRTDDPDERSPEPGRGEGPSA